MLAIWQAAAPSWSAGYNEVVFDLQCLVAAMPAAVEAVFYHADSSDANRAEAAAMRRGMAEAYGAAAPPLLVFDPQREPSAPWSSAAT